MVKLLRFPLILGLASWYILTGQPDSKTADQKYPLPPEISVIESSVPSFQCKRKKVFVMKEGIKKEIEILEKIVRTKDIDFSKDFEIRTDRYHLVKTDDWWPSQVVGQLLSIPSKLYFWDHNISFGVDKRRAQAALAILENRNDLKNITVRLNHNEAIYDGCRLFTDEKVVQRNPFLARATLGVLICLKDEIWAELFRGDYYNPMSQTAVVYSNVESIGAHEIGHHKDFQKFRSDWLYTLGRILPPVMLYQEWKASAHAKEFISQDDKYQFKRYLLPAFFTYCLATYSILFRRRKKEDN